MPATGSNRFVTTSLPEFLLLALEADVVFAMDAVRRLHSVVVCYDVQDFYKRYDAVTARRAADAVSLDEFVSYCDSKIHAEFAAHDDATVAGRCCATISDLIRTDAWAQLYGIAGPRLMKYLLFGCLVFVPLRRPNVYYCVRTPSQHAGRYEVLQSFRMRQNANCGGNNYMKRRRRRGNSDARANVSVTAASFTIAGLLKATEPVRWGAPVEDLLRDILQRPWSDDNDEDDDEGDGEGDDNEFLAALESKLKALAARDTLRAHRDIYESTVGRYDSAQGGGAEVPLGRVKKFAITVVRKIVPRQLFGETRNRDRYCDNLCRVLNGGKAHAFTAQHVVHGIKTNKVGWLGRVDAARRPDALARMLVWLTNRFVFARIVHFFRVVPTNGPSHGVAYFAKARWAAVCREKLSPLMNGDGGFFRELRDDADDKRSSYRDWTVCPYAKPNGVRLIFKPRRNMADTKQLSDDCLTFLQCLVRTYPREFRSVSRPLFFRGWAELQQSGGDDATLFYVRTDFRDAFTSFKHDKLLEVVRNRTLEQFGKKSQNLRVHSVDVVKIGNARGAVYCKKQKFYGGLPEPDFPASSLVFYDATAEVPLCRVWEGVRKCVQCNAVETGGRRWAMTRGIVQGDRLSVALCDLLLADLQATQLTQVVGGDGRLYRFVDDYVFASSDRAAAARFLAAMSAGFEEYGLQLNYSKTETNAEDGGEGTFNFLGFRLNAATGEVTKDMTAYRNRRPLHLFDYGLGRGPGCGRTLYAKITSPHQHPVPKALVSGSFNTVATVARNLASVVAHKAFAVVAAVKQYFFHVNPAFLLRTVHAVARLMYGKVCAMDRQSAVTPMQCKWIVYEVYAVVFGRHLSDRDGRIVWLVDRLRRRQSAVSQKCNVRFLKAALRRFQFVKMFA